ncbi:MAG: ABC transporter permease [Polyangiaceae bacterium]
MGVAVRGLARAGRRLAWAALVVVVVTTLSFFVIEVVPGDPARMLLGPQASAEDVARARDIYGLDRPVWERYARFWGRLVHTGPRVIDPKKDREHRSCGAVALGVHVDLGFSFHWRKPVVDLLAAKMPRSLQLGFAAFVVQAVMGIGLGLFAASRRADRAGRGDARGDGAGVERAGVSRGAAVAIRARLPAAGAAVRRVRAYAEERLPVGGAACHHARCSASRCTRGSRATRWATAPSRRFPADGAGEGASRARVLFVHALRAAAVPIVTIAARDLGTMVGGAIVTEKMFRWPGVG